MYFDARIDYGFADRRDVDFSDNDSIIENFELSNLDWHLNFEEELNTESLDNDFYDEFNEGPNIIGSFLSFMVEKSFELIKK
tara:strand:- start:1866 stop:2111 length:246 start_codon:yes stop_codon:yes gene_type:complete